MKDTDLLTAADVGAWAQNVIERNSAVRIKVSDFKTVTTEMQAAFDKVT